MRRARCFNQQYARRHGYDYVSSQRPLSSGNWSAAAWERLPLLVDAFAARQKGTWLDAVTVVWLDADLQIVDMNSTFDRLFTQCGNRAELIMLSDVSWVAQAMKKGGRWCCLGKCACVLNTGLLALRGSAPSTWAQSLLRRMPSDPRCRTYLRARQWCAAPSLILALERTHHYGLRRMLLARGCWPAAGWLLIPS